MIALNSPYSYKYDIGERRIELHLSYYLINSILSKGAGGIWLLAYVMKRVPKGWIFRQNPEPFEAILEGPSYEVNNLYYS